MRVNMAGMLFFWRAGSGIFWLSCRQRVGFGYAIQGAELRIAVNSLE